MNPVGGGGGGGGTTTVTVTVDNHVVPMKYYTAYQTNASLFNFTCTVSSSNGFVVDGYQWSNQKDTDSFFNPSNADSPNLANSSVQLYMTYPEILKVTCFVNGHYASSPNTQVRFSDYEYVLGYGGMLYFGVIPGDVATYDNDNTALGSSDASQPWYVEYFFAPGTYYGPQNPALMQQYPQIGKVVAGTQPTGVTITWSIGSLAVLNQVLTNASPTTQLSLYPSATGKSTVTGTFNASFVDPKNNTTYTGSALDDTTTVPITAGGTTYYTDIVDAHQPTSITDPLLSSAAYPQLPAGATGWLSIYGLQLYDERTQLMPGIWFNEFFTNAIPPNFSTNYSTGFVWTSDLSVSPNNTQRDYVGYWWPNPATAQQYSTTHQYRAATKLAGIMGTQVAGLLIGTYTMFFIPGGANNVPPAQAYQQ